MKKETKKLILGTAMAGVFAAGISMAKITPAFAQDAGTDSKPAAEKNSCKGKEGCKGKEAHAKNGCKGSCKSKNGCKGKKHHGKKKGADAEKAAPAEGGDAGAAKTTE